MMLIELPAPEAVDPRIDDGALLERVVALAGRERELRADFIVSLGLFEERRLHLKAGYPSLFVWLTDELHFSRASAFRRSTAAQICRSMPAAAAYLREGRLSLTKLCHLRHSLHPTNCLALLEQAASMTEKEVEILAQQLHPDAVTKATRDLIRPLPVPPPPASCDAQADLFAAPMPPAPAAPGPAPEVRHVIRMTVGPDFMKLLDDVKAALSHSHPGASLEVILGECMRRTLTSSHARTRAQVQRPRVARSAAKPGVRTPPAPLRREIWARDQGRCTFVSEGGTRCSATRRLEIHHEVPAAKGGPTNAANCRLACKAHNDLLARRDFGDAHMDRFTGSVPLAEPMPTSAHRG